MAWFGRNFEEMRQNRHPLYYYRKPTHTDRLLDQSSFNPTSHKATTIQTLTRRAQLICDSPDSLADENNYLDNVFNKNNYDKDFVRRNTYKNTEPNSRALLRLSHGFYSPTASVQLTNRPDYHFTTTTDESKGQRRTEPQTGSSLQDLMLRLPGHLYR